MVWDENFYIMLLSYERYQTFIGDKKIADTQSISGALIAFSLPNAESVKNLGRLASENGGKTFHLENGIPENIMYDLEIQDLDGNSLQPIWMATESDNH